MVLYGRVNQNQVFAGEHSTGEEDKKTKSKRAPAFSFGSSSRFGGSSRMQRREKEPALCPARSSLGKQSLSTMPSKSGSVFATGARFAKDKPRKEKMLDLGSSMGKQKLSTYKSGRAVRFYEGGTRLYPLIKDGDPRTIQRNKTAARTASGPGDCGLGSSSLGKQLPSGKPTAGTMVFGRAERMPWIMPKDNPAKDTVDVAKALKNESKYKSYGSVHMGAMPKDKMPR
eukprot:g3534.t1